MWEVELSNEHASQCWGIEHNYTITGNAVKNVVTDKNYFVAHSSWCHLGHSMQRRQNCQRNNLIAYAMQQLILLDTTLKFHVQVANFLFITRCAWFRDQCVTWFYEQIFSRKLAFLKSASQVQKTISFKDIVNFDNCKQMPAENSTKGQAAMSAWLTVAWTLDTLLTGNVSHDFYYF